MAKKVFNDRLGEAILTTTSGLTLYSLSVEANGRFICANMSCLSAWRPLNVPVGAKPGGPVMLGTVRRPGGQLQVTTRSTPSSATELPVR